MTWLCSGHSFLRQSEVSLDRLLSSRLQLIRSTLSVEPPPDTMYRPQRAEFSAGRTRSSGRCRELSRISRSNQWLQLGGIRSFYPQIWINYRRKSTTGISMDFLCLNPIGFACLTVRPAFPDSRKDATQD